MADFAKIVRASDGAQVLFFKDNDSEGAPCLTQVTEEDGVTAKLGISFTDDDDGGDKRDVAFNGSGVEQADGMRALVLKALGRTAGVTEAQPARWLSGWGQSWTVLDALKHARMLLARRGETDARIDAVLAGTAGVTAVHPDDELGNFARWFINEYGFAPDHHADSVRREFKAWCAARPAGVRATFNDQPKDSK